MQDKLNLDALKKFIQEPIPRQILFFDEMLTPRLLQVVYWAALVAVVWEGLAQVFSGSFHGFIQGIVFIALGCLLARVVSELIMLFFQLHENMETVAKNTAGSSDAAAPKRVAKKVAKKASKKVSKKS